MENLMSEHSINVGQHKFLPAAFVFYHPKTSENKIETVYYNAEAWNILSMSSGVDKKTIVVHNLITLCVKWKTSFDKIHKEAIGNNKVGNTVNYCVDMLESYRRKYVVRATRLVTIHNSPMPTTQQPNNPTTHHLFMLERFCPKNLNLSAGFRQWNLSQREQQIAKLLIEDRSNKEIARILCLSTNTVKVYIRFLMTKLKAGSRTGIVSQLLSTAE